WSRRSTSTPSTSRDAATSPPSTPSSGASLRTWSGPPPSADWGTARSTTATPAGGRATRPCSAWRRTSGTSPSTCCAPRRAATSRRPTATGCRRRRSGGRACGSRGSRPWTPPCWRSWWRGPPSWGRGRRPAAHTPDVR
ncbi:MAG: hypothetical protein AVDCRST_MAG66-1998, partial [uncultured Pseudonocardia sp.]